MSTSDTLKHMAHLARIHLEEEEVVLLEKDLQSVLQWMSVLHKIQTTDIEQMQTQHNALREDVVDHNVTRSEILANAPCVKDYLFVVPKVLS